MPPMKAWVPFAENKRESNELREQINEVTLEHLILQIDTSKSEMSSYGL